MGRGACGWTTPPGDAASTPRAPPGRCSCRRPARPHSWPRTLTSCTKPMRQVIFSGMCHRLKKRTLLAPGHHRLPKSRPCSCGPRRGSSAKPATPSPALSWASGPPGPGASGPARAPSPCVRLDVGRWHWLRPPQQANLGGRRGARPAASPGDGPWRRCKEVSLTVFKLLSCRAGRTLQVT